MPQNNITEFLKKNMAVSIIAFISLLFFIFALFQYFAPENAKPFKTAKSESSSTSKTTDSKQAETKTTDSNSTADSTKDSTNTTPPSTIKPLVADDKSFVHVSNSCDLAIKYPKNDKFDSTPVQIFVSKEGSDLDNLKKTYSEYVYSKYLLPKDLVYTIMAPLVPADGAVSFDIMCFDKAYKFDDFNSSFTQKDTGLKRFEDDGNFGPAEYKDLDKTTFCADIGLTKVSCDNIANLKYVYMNFVEGHGDYYYFTYKDMTYVVNIGSYGKNKLTLQFNSFAPSTSNAPIKSNEEINKEYPFNPTNPDNLQSYTNQYFPNFKLVYDKSWSFSTKTKNSGYYTGLLDRSIDLSKGDLRFNITLTPGVVGCGGSGYPENLVTLKSGVNRFTVGYLDENSKPVSQPEIQYSKSKVMGCTENAIQSNIDAKSYAKYKNQFPNDSKVKYSFQIQASKNAKPLNNGMGGFSSEPVKISDTAIIAEFDKIVSDSIFK